MWRMSMPCCGALAALGLVSSTALADGGLVRIEPRPYYGAVVTIEHNVRVFRALPSPQLMIINPNRTPVNLSFNKTVEYRAALPVAATSDGAAYGGPAIYSAGYGGFGSGHNWKQPRKVQPGGVPTGPAKH